MPRFAPTRGGGELPRLFYSVVFEPESYLVLPVAPLQRVEGGDSATSEELVDEPLQGVELRRLHVPPGRRLCQFHTQRTQVLRTLAQAACGPAA